MLPMKSRYALKALVYLARFGGEAPMPVSVIAQAENIPAKFLEAILLELRNHAILDSKRGRGGGYTLRMPPDEIALGNMIRLVSGPLAPLPCLSRTAYHRCPECVDESTCAVRLLMAESHAATLRILDKTTLADLVRRIESAAGWGFNDIASCI